MIKITTKHGVNYGAWGWYNPFRKKNWWLLKLRPPSPRDDRGWMYSIGLGLFGIGRGY